MSGLAWLVPVAVLAVLAWRKLPALLGPVFVYDALRMARRGRYVVLRCAYALVLLLTLMGFHAVWFGLDLEGLTRPGALAPNEVARFGAGERARLLRDKGIVRNRAKIKAAIVNAGKFLEVQREFGTFSKYMWTWVEGRPIVHKLRKLRDFPACIPEAEAWARDLKERGFKFLGPTVVYAHMQAAGMVNDHTVDCFRYRALARK